MRAIKLIETDIALKKRSLLTSNMCQSRLIQKEIKTLYSELEAVKARRQTESVKARVYMGESELSAEGT